MAWPGRPRWALARIGYNKLWASPRQDSLSGGQGVFRAQGDVRALRERRREAADLGRETGRGGGRDQGSATVAAVVSAVLTAAAAGPPGHDAHEPSSREGWVGGWVGS